MATNGVAMDTASSQKQLRHALKEVDANLKRVQKLCPGKNNDKEIASDVSKFRGKIRVWFNSLTSPSQPESPSCLPILSPVNSPPSTSKSSPSTAPSAEEQDPKLDLFADKVPGTPSTGGRGYDSDGLPPTPKLSATPSTCNIMRYVTAGMKEGGNEDQGDSGKFAFPTLTPAGQDVANRPTLDSDGNDLIDSTWKSPGTPHLDSSPTTTIQLSPSHFTFADPQPQDQGQAKTGGVHGFNIDAPVDCNDLSSTSSVTADDDLTIEEKLMSSLYIDQMSCQKSKSKRGSYGAQQSQRKEFDISLFPKVFQSGEGAVELRHVYDKVMACEKQVLWSRDIKRIVPEYEVERTRLLLEVLMSRGFVEFMPAASDGTGECWKVC